VLDSKLRLPQQSRLFAIARDTPLWIVVGEHAPAAAEQAARAHGAEVVRAVEKNGRLDLHAVLNLLATRGITRLMVEPGPTLAAALIDIDLIDEAVFFHSPMVIGDGGLPAMEPRAVELFDQRLKRVSSEPVGSDRQETFERGTDHV
jgi:diaminohydroxyphosphoribosylaminopyrimidine deaminase/5-amino-6-(5-phosphoribosylamino)uracil reductase